MLQRDVQRLDQLRQRVLVLPLGRSAMFDSLSVCLSVCHLPSCLSVFLCPAWRPLSICCSACLSFCVLPDGHCLSVCHLPSCLSFCVLPYGHCLSAILPVCLSVSCLMATVCLSVCLPSCLSVFLCPALRPLSVCLPSCLSVSLCPAWRPLSICPPAHLPSCLSFWVLPDSHCLSFWVLPDSYCLSVCPPALLSVFLCPTWQPLSVCPPICLSVSCLMTTVCLHNLLIYLSVSCLPATVCLSLCDCFSVCPGEKQCCSVLLDFCMYLSAFLVSNYCNCSYDHFVCLPFCLPVCWVCICVHMPVDILPV